MKVEFSQKLKYVPEFNGNKQLADADQLVTYLQPLKMNDLLLLVDVLQNIDGGDIQANPEAFKGLIEKAGDLIPQYCEIQNLSDSEGNALDVAAVTTYPFFMELAAEVLTEMASISMPNEEEVKNSQLPLA